MTKIRIVGNQNEFANATRYSKKLRSYLKIRFPKEYLKKFETEVFPRKWASSLSAEPGRLLSVDIIRKRRAKGKRVDEEFADISRRRSSTSSSEKIFHRPILGLDRKRAATLSLQGTVGKRGRGGGKGGIKGQEINASISSNTMEHSSALWRRVCAPHTFFLLFEKLLRVQSFIQLKRWDRASSLRSALRPNFSYVPLRTLQLVGLETPAMKIPTILNLLPPSDRSWFWLNASEHDDFFRRGRAR